MKFGGVAMEKLCIIVPVQNGSDEVDRLFYRVIGGDKNPKKQKIIDQCLILIAMKWKKTTPKAEIGQEYEPATFCKMIQQLFLVFRRKNILYDWKSDFNNKGEFHGQMKEKWRKTRLNDPTFGTMKRKAEFDIDVDRKVRIAIKDGSFKPFSDPKHLTMAVQFILGRYVAFRGASEHHELTHNNIHRSTYGSNDGDLDGLNYYGVKVAVDKMNQLGFNMPNCAPDSTHLLTFVENPKDEIFDPVAIFDYYLDHCHDDAVFFYA